MLFFENIKIALSAIWTNRTRSFLTTLGILIGVFSVITLMSIGQGVRQDVVEQIEGLGSNLITVVPGKIDTDMGGQGTGMIGTSTLNVGDAEELEKLEEIEVVTPIKIVANIVSYQGKIAEGAMIFGSTPKMKNTFSSDLGEEDQGRFLNQDDVDEKKKVVAIHKTIAENLFGENKEVVGKKINIGKEEFEIIGTIKSKEQASLMGEGFIEGMVVIPITVAIEMTDSSEIHRIMVKAKEADKLEETKEKMKEVLLERHGEVEDFSILTQKDLLAMMDTILNLLTYMLTGIASISLLVGGIGIMNIMLVSVTERTKHIGIRKAVGASSGNVFTQFLIEALVLSLIGGGLGIGFASLAAWAIEKYSPLNTEITLFSIVLAFGISTLIGLVFGVAPAIRASRLNPIDALRYE